MNVSFGNFQVDVHSGAIPADSEEKVTAVASKKRGCLAWTYVMILNAYLSSKEKVAFLSLPHL